MAKNRLGELLQSATVSAHGLDITIDCDDQETRDAIIDALLESVQDTASLTAPIAEGHRW